MASGLNDVTWDSTSANIRFGSLKVSVQKLEPSKVEIKTEKLRPVGSALQTRRTPGVAEVADTSAEVLTSDYEALILPRMPVHGGTLVIFQITANHRHVAVAGSYSILLADCRLVSVEGPPLGDGEKGLITKLGISVMRRYDKGRDGIWKTLAYDSRKPSSEAQALMKF